MRIVHFSDWHGHQTELPPADLYICTGDMLPDVAAQLDWAREHPIVLPAPVLCVAGNHDFVPIGGLFKAPVVREFTDPNWDGSVVPAACVPGTVMPPAWGWADSVSEETMARRLEAMPPKPADILMTHGPGFSVLDKGGRYRQHLGSTAIADWVVTYNPRVHLFGHIHESFGFAVHGETLSVNSAVGWHLIEAENGEFTVRDWGRLNAPVWD